MPCADWLHIESQLEMVEMPVGSTLHEAGSSLRHVYFPTTAVVSLISTMLDGASVELAAVGS
ncbi:MAG: Crp/Fnr family transcriptional regulator, partial [Comamonadaceae bacterium]|nr:Crp/Fnr family transcriptional regulator [Comamonadaceae bacterium]